MQSRFSNYIFPIHHFHFKSFYFFISLTLFPDRKLNECWWESRLKIFHAYINWKLSFVFSERRHKWLNVVFLLRTKTTRLFIMWSKHYFIILLIFTNVNISLHNSSIISVKVLQLICIIIEYRMLRKKTLSMLFQCAREQNGVRLFFRCILSSWECIINIYGHAYKHL